MIEKIEKLLDLAILGAMEFRNYYASMNGELPLERKPWPTTPAAAADPVVEEKPKRGRPKVEKVTAPAAEPVEANPFEMKPSAENFVEAKRRTIEVMGAFIKGKNGAKQPGLALAKAISKEKLGRDIQNLEELTYEDCVKLIPAFEAELNK